MTRFVAVVGAKQSGKTVLVNQIVSVLRNRGYSVATIKDSSCTQTVDPLAESGAELVAVLTKNETKLFLKKRLSFKELIPFLGDMDYVVLEGFEDEKVFAKIVVAHTKEEFDSFSDGLALAACGKLAQSFSEIVQEGLKIPVFDATADSDKIVDVVEQKAFMMLPNLVGCSTCHSVGECGYVDCYKFAKAMVTGKSEATGCPLNFKENVVVEINGLNLPLKNFPQSIIQNSLLGMFSSLHGVEKIQTLNIKININET